MAGHDTEMPADAARSMGLVVSALPQISREPEVAVDVLADCVRRLDPGTRALLDLSVRRRLRDDAMAPLLRTDAFHLAWRRARALERVATDLGGDQPVPLAKVRAALERLPREAWDPLSTPALPRPGATVREFRVAPKPAPEPPAAEPEEIPLVSTELVPAAAGELDAPRERLSDRLDAFAAASPTFRDAFAGVGRAFARKAVRLVVWPRRR
jgi:hypothetical protein